MPMNVPRARFDVALANNCIYAVGGSDGHNDLSSFEYLTEECKAWTLIPNCPVARTNTGNW